MIVDDALVDELVLDRTMKSQRRLEIRGLESETHVEEAIEEEDEPRTGAEILDASYLERAGREKRWKDQLASASSRMKGRVNSPQGHRIRVSSTYLS